jgi:hypothetical protein
MDCGHGRCSAVNHHPRKLFVKHRVHLAGSMRFVCTSFEDGHIKWPETFCRVNCNLTASNYHFGFFGIDFEPQDVG